MNKQIENALNFDPLDQVEKMVGKHWSEFDESENAVSLVAMMKNNEVKRKLLVDSKDTYWGIKWDEYLNLLSNNDFELIYSKEFKYDVFNKIEIATMHKHKEHELFIWSTSWDKQSSVNLSTVYGYFKGDRKYLCGSNGWENESELWYFDYDGREGLIHKLNNMNDNGNFGCGNWSERFLYFLDYSKEDKSNNHKEVTKNVINNLPDNIRRIFMR